MANWRLLFKNHNAYYDPLARNALREFGVGDEFRNGAKHALTTADLSRPAQLGRELTLRLGRVLEWSQYLYGRDSFRQKGHRAASQENVKDLTANVIGSYAQKYLADMYGDVSVKSRAQAIAMLARDGLIPKDFNHAARLRSLDLPARIAESLNQADFQSGQVGVSPTAEQIWARLKIGPRRQTELDEEWYIRPQSP